MCVLYDLAPLLWSVLQIEHLRELSCSWSSATWSMIFWSLSAEESENVLIFLTTFSCSLSTAKQASVPPRELILLYLVTRAPTGKGRR